ncbi:hypothetical protein AAF712_016386, partial [Marasmius tenuissimus]
DSILLHLWPWERITVLKLANCDIEPSSLRSALERAQNLDTLHILDITLQNAMEPVTLLKLQTLSVKIRAIRCCDVFTVPLLRYLSLSAGHRDDTSWLPRIIRMAQRSYAKLEEIDISGDILQNEAQMKDLFRAVGAGVKVLTLTGRISNTMISWILSSPDQCLPGLQSFTVVGEKLTPNRLTEFRFPKAWLNVPFGLLPFLSKVLTEASLGRQRSLKKIELGVYTNGHPVRVDHNLAKRVRAMRDGGMSVEFIVLDHVTSPILEHLGKVLGGEILLLSLDGTSLVENMPAISNVFSIVEKYLDERYLLKEDIKVVIYLSPEKSNLLEAHQQT